MSNKKVTMRAISLILLFGLHMDIISAKPKPDIESEVIKLLSNTKKLGSNLEKDVVKLITGVDQGIQKTYHDFIEVIDEWTHQAKNISLDYYKAVAGLIDMDGNCSCRSKTCGCCYHIVFEKISMNEKGCLSATYLAEEYGFQFNFTLDGKAIIDRKITVKNPPPICAFLPYHLANLCLRFYNLDYADKHFTGCAVLEAELDGVVVKSLELSCLRILAPTYYFP